MKYGRILIFGGSSGIGLATAEHLAPHCEELITISRRSSPVGTWIKTDLTQTEDIVRLADQVTDQPIDGLLYLGGTWETHAFTDEYSYETCSDEDLENVINVNLLAPIRVIQALLPGLKKSKNSKVIITGAAIAGLTLTGGKEVSNTAAMLGLRGMVLSLRQNLKQHKIGVSLLKPGYVATPEVLEDIKASGISEDHVIPMSDLMNIIEMVLNLSNRTNINEIEFPTML